MRPTDRLGDVAQAALLVLAIVLLLAGPGAAQPPELPRIDGPLTMEQAVDLALQHSLRVKAAQADQRTMESMRREAQAPLWPQVSANGYVASQTMTPNVYSSAGQTMARNFQVFGTNEARDANVTGMYDLFAGGRHYYGYKAAVFRAQAGEQMRRGTETEVAMQARLDYVAAQREAEQARVTAGLVRQVEERLRVSRAMLDGGRIPRYYVLRDEAELANAIQMNAMAESRAAQALVALKTTLGADLGSRVTLSERLVYAPVTVSAADGLRDALETHPDLQAAVRQRKAAEAEVRAAYGAYLPQVSVGAMYDWAWLKNRSEQSTTDQGYSVGLVVTLPVFDGFMRRSALDTARAKLDRAIQAEGLIRQQIARDVTQAALMLAAARTSVEASGKGLEQAEEEARIVRERFEAGRGVQVEVLDAQVSLTRAHFNVVAALAEHRTALAMWLKATGRVH